MTGITGESEHKIRMDVKNRRKAVSKMLMLIVILLPMLSGALIPAIPFKNRRAMCIYIEFCALIDSALVFLLLHNPPEEALTVFRFTGN